MNTISEAGGAGRSRPGRKPMAAWGAALLAALALGSCIQGPWDYYPENPPYFRGIYLTGYAIAGSPIRQVCMERLLELTEEATDAFPFYAAADVRVSGRFGDTVGTVVLSPLDDAPNCFIGDSTALVRAGEEYALEARVDWDSAGARVTSVLTATARVPERFEIQDSADAPGLAATGGTPENIFSLGFFQSLPPDTRKAMLAEYGDTLLKLQSDTAALNAFAAENADEAVKLLLDRLKDETATYRSGDSLYYLRGVLNTLSHKFASDYSSDVAGVLIVHRFDSTTGRPETAFDGFFGSEIDTGEFYYEGSTRRLGLYTSGTGPDGYSVLKNIGIVNTWFHTGLNRLYFYGVEQAYADYIGTALEAEGNPRIQVRQNVRGGRGVFAGAVPDSFDVFIKTDSLTKVYSLDMAHAEVCREEGWFSAKHCSDFYRPYCEAEEWKPESCRFDAIRASLEADFRPDTALAQKVADSAASARQDTSLARRATIRFCVENGFPEGETCAAPTRDCLEQSGANACKEHLWNFCRQNRWRPDQCAPAVASYCNDKPRLSEALCREADKYCAANAGSVLCE